MARQTKRVSKLNKRLAHKFKAKKYHSIESKLKIIDYLEQNGKHLAAKKIQNFKKMTKEKVRLDKDAYR